MKGVDRVLGPELGGQWRRIVIRLAVATLVVFAFAWSAAARVAGLDPRVAGFRLSAAAVLPAILLVLAGSILALLVLLGIQRIIARFGRRDATADPAPAGTLVLLLLGFMALHLGPRFLVMPLRTPAGTALIPIVSVTADRYVVPVSSLFLIEMVLAFGALLLDRSSLWWRTRFLVGLAWCAVLAWIITGPNLLRGEPLEWADALKSRAVPQAWMATAPHSLESWWPALQIVLAAALLSVVLLIVQDLSIILRSFRKARATS